MLNRSKAGSLIHGRQGHGAIFDGENFLIIGGRKQNVEDPVKNEVCTLNNSTMTCVEQTTALRKYVFYPELFLVTGEYAKDKDSC